MSQAVDEKYTLVTTPTEGAAGTTDIESAFVDMAGFTGVKFMIPLGAIVTGAVTSAMVQQNTANSGTGVATLAGSTVDILDSADGQLVVIDVKNPTERYLRAKVDRGTQNATVGGIIAVQYGPRNAPVANDGATVHSVTTLISPAEA